MIVPRHTHGDSFRETVPGPESRLTDYSTRILFPDLVSTYVISTPDLFLSTRPNSCILAITPVLIIEAFALFHPLELMSSPSYEVVGHKKLLPTQVAGEQTGTKIRIMNPTRFKK